MTLEASRISCLRCNGVELARLPLSTAEIAFFECPSCLRHYAQKAGGGLTYRWLHPTSVALYGVMFEENPLPYAERIAQHLLESSTTDEIARMTDEIELELRQPTRDVRDIIGSRATEEACRRFLAAVVAHLKR